MNASLTIKQRCVIYKQFINDSCDIRAKRKNPFIHPSEIEENSLNGKLNLETIQDRIHEDVFMSYAYGIYISNRLAHLFDVISINPIDNSEMRFSEEFKDVSHKREIKKKAFAYLIELINRNILTKCFKNTDSSLYNVMELYRLHNSKLYKIMVDINYIYEEVSNNSNLTEQIILDLKDKYYDLKSYCNTNPFSD